MEYNIHIDIDIISSFVTKVNLGGGQRERTSGINYS